MYLCWRRVGDLRLLVGFAVWAMVANANGEVSLKSDIFPLLQKKCASCHGANGGFSIGESSQSLYDALIAPKQTPCKDEPEAPRAGDGVPLRVDSKKDPVNPDGTFFYRKIATNDCGAKMAINGRLLKNEIELVHKWIAEGAKNN